MNLLEHKYYNLYMISGVYYKFWHIGSMYKNIYHVSGPWGHEGWHFGRQIPSFCQKKKKNVTHSIKIQPVFRLFPDVIDMHHMPRQHWKLMISENCEHYYTVLCHTIGEGLFLSVTIITPNDIGQTTINKSQNNAVCPRPVMYCWNILTQHKNTHTLRQTPCNLVHV
jgi:hypothetical protein